MAFKKDEFSKLVARKSGETALPPRKETMGFVAFRLRPSHREALRAHFASQGISLSAGVRKIVLDYMAAQRLR